ncbi:MAG: FAD-dependent oxidoreductase [Granulosicoccus sp.]|nr:FAD-dependent oxidoreductase [Granulosicoccus sp.]
MHHVVIGAGPAGVVAAEHLKKYDPTSTVTLLGAEDKPPYSRMAIPYYLVGDIEQQGTFLRKNATHFSDLGIDCRQMRVSSIDPGSKNLRLMDGDMLSYDKLLLATGATPVKPPIPGIDLEAVHNCWTLADAEKIVSLAAPNSKVVLMGAGFIGCIILESLANRKVDLTVVEMENRMVSRMTNETMGTMIKDWCVDKGINVLTSTKVSEIREGSGGTALSVALDSGATMDADLVICATGVRSNTAFLEGTGIEVRDGVVVDEYLQTSVADIYAAGDVAQGKDFSTGDYYVQAIQPTAVEHGRVAAHNMARGHKSKHNGTVNMNILDTVGLISTSFGMWMGVEGGEESELVDTKNFKYINLQFKDDHLVGASSLGMTQHVGAMRGLIQTGAELGEWKAHLLKDPTRIMEAYLATVQQQSKKLSA